jgi:glycosyltransferase involved in cell wall biosynthesis
VFSGTFSSYIGLAYLCEALKDLKSFTSKFRFVMIGQGEGEEGMRRFIEESGMEDQMIILPFMDRSELVSYIGAADFCFASLRDSPMLRYAIPTKIIEYLACNKNVLAVVSGPFAEMLKDADAAYVCSPGDVAGLVKVLKSLVESHPECDLNRNPRALIEKSFSLDAFERGFCRFFDGVSHKDVKVAK